MREMYRNDTFNTVKGMRLSVPEEELKEEGKV